MNKQEQTMEEKILPNLRNDNRNNMNKKTKTKCTECGGEIPKNRIGTCSKECYDIWNPKFFKAMKDLSKKLPVVKLHL